MFYPSQRNSRVVNVSIICLRISAGYFIANWTFHPTEIRIILFCVHVTSFGSWLMER